MTPTAKRNARKRGYHHDAIIAAQLGVEWRPSPGAWAYQVAEDLGVSLRTVYRWVESGRVPQSHAARAYVEGGRVVITNGES